MPSACRPARTRVTVLWWSAPCTLIARANPRSHLVMWYATSGTKYVGSPPVRSSRMTRSLSSPKSVVLSQSAPSFSIRVAGGDRALDRVGRPVPSAYSDDSRKYTSNLHAERLEVAILFLAQLAHGEHTHRIEIVGVAVRRMLVDVALREIANVLAVISALGNGTSRSAKLSHARLHAEREILICAPASL